jgi:hypothetical protein
VNAAVDDAFVQGRRRLQGRYLTVVELGLQVLPVLLRVDQRQLEVQVFLFGHLQRDIPHQIEAEVAPSRATGADDKGHAATSINRRSRFTADLGNWPLPVASGSGPVSVEPASQAMKWGSNDMALVSELSRKPEPSIPVGATARISSMLHLLVGAAC